MKHALIPLVIFVLVLSAVLVGICECTAQAQVAFPETAAFTNGPCACCDSCQELSSTCFSEPEAIFLENVNQTAYVQPFFEQLMRVDPALLLGGVVAHRGFELFPALSRISFFISHHQFRL